MKFLKITALLFFFALTAAFSQKSFLSYYELNDFLYASPGAFKFGLYGFNNPALLNTLQESDLLFAFSNKNFSNRNPRLGLFAGSPGSGAGFIRTSDGKNIVYDYRYAASFGSKYFGIGLGYGFVGGRKGFYKRSNTFYAGSFWRPIPYLSIGAQFTQAIDNHDKEYIAELALRPIKNYPLTFFADYGMFDDQNPEQAKWSAGISYEVIDGVRLSGRYFNNKAFNAGIDISLGTTGVGAQSNFTKNSSNSYDYGYSTFFIRAGALDRTIIKDFTPEKKFLNLSFDGSVKYQRNALFDEGNTLISLLELINTAKKEDKISGLVINITNFGAGKEILWELREKLKDFKTTGKKVYLFVDRLGIDDYHFASVADKIIMDELGSISLEGYMLGRSFYKQMLEKSGIGFEELRYFKYKSAVENFSREKMSEADKEQRQKVVDDWLKITKNEICESRKFSPEQFDSLLNNQIIYSAKNALDKKLVDMTGRWDNVDSLLKKLEGDKTGMIYPNLLFEHKKPIDDQWGKKDKCIAIIYAIGECAMDQGIKARKLINDLKFAFASKEIDAIVLRVDSPGGDALASDYIANVMRQNKNKKPVIVSQGMVAGSGGYWLSMYGDKIVASPMTITGSIGVISGRIYDNGLKDKLGITVDMVKSGKYADLGQSFALPLIDIGLPVRNYNEDEKKQIEKEIRDMYADFVSKVAFGRKMSDSAVGIIAQGRIWSGLDGKQLGLVDEIGGLEKAIELAKAAANIGKDEDVEFIELPKPQLFDLSSLLSSMISMNINSLVANTLLQKTTDPVLDYIRFRAKNNDLPMLIMPIEYQDLVPKQ